MLASCMTLATRRGNVVPSLSGVPVYELSFALHGVAFYLECSWVDWSKGGHSLYVVVIRELARGTIVK